MKNIDAQNLKQLQSRLSIKTSKRESVSKEIECLKEELNYIDRGILKIRKEIKAIEDGNKGLIVSEHAIVRYFERCLGQDLEEVKRDILTDSLIACVKNLGDGKHPIGKKRRAVVKNNIVVTIE